VITVRRTDRWGWRHRAEQRSSKN